MPGINTPEGQGFGHCLVIAKQRIFNIVDPEAATNNGVLLKEMRAHFISFWNSGGIPKLLKRVRSAFDDQNVKLGNNSKTPDPYRNLLAVLESDFDEMAAIFRKLKPQDFEFAFHAFPDNSVGHLHMHVFPKASFLRRFSTKQHDWKTIPIEVVLEVEMEDKASREAQMKASGVNVCDESTNVGHKICT